MLTISELFFWYPDAKINLWSQSLIFAKTFSDFPKMDKKNVQNQKSQILLGIFFFKI
jgi:hypothetical protein